MPTRDETGLGRYWSNKDIGAEERNMGYWCDLLPDDQIYKVKVNGLEPDFEGWVIGKDKFLDHDVIFDGKNIRGADRRWVEKV